MAELKKRLIDANALKDLRDKFIHGKIHFDYEGDMVDACPTVEAVPIEELEHLRNELYENDLITMKGLKRLNTLIKKYTCNHIKNSQTANHSKESEHNPNAK